MKLDTVIKNIGKETQAELDSLSAEDLKAKIVQAEQAMDEVAKELEANEKYQEIKELLKAMTQGKKEVNKRQKAIIQYALHRLNNE